MIPLLRNKSQQKVNLRLYAEHSFSLTFKTLQIFIFTVRFSRKYGLIFINMPEAI